MRKFILSALLLSVLMLTSCEKLGLSTPEETTAATEPTVPREYPVVVNSVTFNSAPKRVVVLTPFIGEIIGDFGFESRVVGRVNECVYPDKLVEKTSIGSGLSPDYNRIIALSPDVLLTSAELPQQERFFLEKNNVKILTIEYPTSISALKNVYRDIGRLFGGEQTGGINGEEVFAPLSHALDNSKAVNLGNFVYITEGIRAATPDTLESAVLSCFGRNAADGTRYNADKDAILGVGVNLIILGGDYPIADSFLSLTAAYGEGRVIKIDNAYFERPSLRLVKLIEQVTDEYIRLN
ncbi:MAG: ABC transporter substrate-binding protein [Oscillospiraceae bacterium]|jgi:ABC-type Fe3+-hydroxamate transport system substrate-binding protein|nr:ABC transporter substrate-binding protein [Oscillospiraceae bacterium]